jgi:hypothetical protein
MVAVRVAPMCDGRDVNNPLLIVNGIKHAIRPDSDALPFSAAQLAASARPRLLFQFEQSLNHTI